MTRILLPALILRLLAGLVPTALLLLTWLLVGVLGLLTLMILSLVTLVLVGHSSISCVEPFNGATTRIIIVRFSSHIKIAGPLRAAIAASEQRALQRNLSKKSPIKTACTGYFSRTAPCCRSYPPLLENGITMRDSDAGASRRHTRIRQRMDYFAQQLINGLVLGSIYGLIAIGYTMVYGIVGMINFAHGDIFMIGGFIALISFLILVSMGLTVVPVILLIVLLVSMAITALYGWTIERIAYRPLRHSFRLAPMLSAIGMSFVLTNYSQVAQGARVKPVPPIITGGYTLHEGVDGFAVRLSNIQIIVVITTIVLLALFTWLVARTRLGRDMRACEQDQTMASLLGVDVDRTISMTFVIGAALAAVAGMMYLLYYGLVDFFMGFVAGIKAFTAAVLGGIGSLPGAMLGGLLIGLIETLWAAYFSTEYKDVAAFSILIVVLIFLPTGLLGRPEVEKV
jgi:branched-chain amino acid transport system permease protein